METFRQIEQWAHDRNLIIGTTPDKQFQKLIEEVGELSKSLLKQDGDLFIDAIGDCVVVLTILAKQKGYRIDDCINAAYDEIKDRKGRMINGVFVKEG